MGFSGATAALNTKLTLPDVADLYAAEPALFAVTTQVVACVALSTPVEATIEQFAPVTENVVAPLPEPPVEVTVMAVPTVPVSVVLVIVRAACELVEKEKLAALVVALLYPLLEALVAVTEQVAALEAVRTPDERPMEQPAPETRNVTAPVPEPPDTVTFSVLPTAAVWCTLEILIDF